MRPILLIMWTAVSYCDIIIIIMCLKHFIYLSHWSYSKIKLESDKRKIPRKVLKKKNLKFKAQRINF